MYFKAKTNPNYKPRITIYNKVYLLPSTKRPSELYLSLIKIKKHYIKKINYKLSYEIVF